MAFKEEQLYCTFNTEHHFDKKKYQTIHYHKTADTFEKEVKSFIDNCKGVVKVHAVKKKLDKFEAVLEPASTQPQVHQAVPSTPPPPLPQHQAQQVPHPHTPKELLTASHLTTAALSKDVEDLIARIKVLDETVDGLIKANEKKSWQT